MLDRRQPAAYPLATLQDRQPLGGGQRVTPQVQGAFHPGLERVEHLDNLFPTTRTHVRILAAPVDGNSPTNPRLWIKVRLWITGQRRHPRTLTEGFDRRLRGD